LHHVKYRHFDPVDMGPWLSIPCLNSLILVCSYEPQICSDTMDLSTQTTAYMPSEMFETTIKRAENTNFIIWIVKEKLVILFTNCLSGTRRRDVNSLLNCFGAFLQYFTPMVAGQPGRKSYMIQLLLTRCTMPQN